MKIDNASLRFVSAYSSREQEERLQASRTDVSSSSAGRLLELNLTYARQENVRLQSSQSAYLYSRSQINSADKAQPVSVHTRESLLQHMVSHAFSRTIRISGTVALGVGTAAGTSRPGQSTAVATQASMAFGQAYRYQSEQYSTLTIEGRLDLADQRSIDFVLHTRMDSSLLFESGSGEFASIAVRTDPLILNLQGGAAQLTDAAFEFDLDGDGNKESISMATGGSGFIAFDRNGDGSINDGSELFGTRSGDGFADLATYDDDGNGFIDANDAIYSQLKYWSRDENGDDHLLSLQDAGIAAIGLQSATTPMQLRGQAAQELGIIRSTGIFVTTDGAVGTVQQVDLTRRDTRQEQAFAADFSNPQFMPGASLTPEQSAGQQQLDEILQRLNNLRADYMARMDAMGDTASEDSKTLLEQLVDMLEIQLKELAEKRDNTTRDNIGQASATP